MAAGGGSADPAAPAGGTAGGRARAPRVWVALAAIGLLTLAHWVVLAAHLPILTRLPWWFWKFSEQPLGAPWLLLPLAGVAAAAAWIGLRPGGARAPRLAALVLLGFAWQHGLGLLEGRGIDGLRDHIVWTGHAQFARAAARQQSVAAVIRDYEELAPRGAHGVYARSKPPGTLLLYVFSERVGRWLRPGLGEQERLAWLQTSASYAWPLLCYLVLIPMAALARRTLHPDAGAIACSLYLLVPSVSLMTLHTDQTFYPLLAVVAVLLAAVAAERGSAVLAGATGVWLYLAVFCSFGLAVVALLAALPAFALARARGAGSDGGSASVRIARLVLATAAGWLASDGIFRLAFGYDIAVRYRSAMAHHLAWKFGWEWTLSNVSYIAWIDTLEFALWLGLPLALVAGAACLRATAIWLRARGAAPGAALGAGLLGVFAGLLLLSRTKGEVSRLWLFLVPFACLAAGDRLARLPAPRRRVFVAALAALQAGTVLLTKVFQDF